MKKLIKILFVVIILLIISIAYIHRQFLSDWVSGLTYHPSEEMSQIRQNLKLTDRGDFLFSASQPQIKSQTDFNDKCRSDYNESTALLGCYTDNKIYVYDINATELFGIKELTTAHELLHASWARLSESDKSELASHLSSVFASHKELLEPEIESYNKEEALEELYTRAGTEIKTLPDYLESHYATIFKDQDAVVDFYNKYIKVFNDLQDKIKSLSTELENLQTTINNQSSEYQVSIDDLTNRIKQFNSCANKSGCFSSLELFNIEHQKLISEQNALSAAHDAIDELINRYNNLVDEYNDVIIQNNKLNQLINSTAAPEPISK